MSWIVLKPRNSGGGRYRGKGWEEFPCIAFGKTSIYLNVQFQEAFDVREGTPLVVLIDKDSGRIGFKKLESGDDSTFAYTARCEKGKRCRSPVLRVNCSAVAKCFPDRVGDVFRARLNHGERVIEISLTERP